jgi:hypothetical protein
MPTNNEDLDLDLDLRDSDEETYDPEEDALFEDGLEDEGDLDYEPEYLDD